MAILVQFNESDSLSYKDIATGTSIAEGILKPQLALLVKAKVLLQEEDTYELNLSTSLPSNQCRGDRILTYRFQVEEDPRGVESASPVRTKGRGDRGIASCR